MAKAPADRHESALAFARTLQKVQIELSHSVTPIDILDDAVVEDGMDDDDDGLTRVRGVVSIDPETGPAAGMTRPATRGMSASAASPASSASYLPPMDAVVRGALVPSEGLDQTVLRGEVAAPSAAGTDDLALAATGPSNDSAGLVEESSGRRTTRSRRGLWIALSAGVVALIVVVAVSLPRLLGTGSEDMPAPDTSSEPQDPVSAIVPEPTDITASAGADGIHFSWTNPDPEDGDYYLYTVVTTATEPEFHSAAETGVTVPADASGTTCIDVVTVRANGQSSDPPARGCTP